MDQWCGHGVVVHGPLRIGGASKEALVDALRAQGVLFNAAAEMLFADSRFTTQDRLQVIPVVAVSVAELGFYAGAAYGDVVTRARASGLSECPLEVGLYLRRQLASQPGDVDGSAAPAGQARPRDIIVASAPLDETDDTPKGFYLRRIDDVSWLRGYWATASHRYDAANIFVFAQRA